jgi:hypothetical protein
MATLEFEMRERAREVAEAIWAALEADENDLVLQVRLIIERALTSAYNQGVEDNR